MLCAELGVDGPGTYAGTMVGGALDVFALVWLNGDGSMGTGGVITGGGGGTSAGPFLDGESHVPMSMLCLPGTIGGGGIPGPFFFKMDEVEFA